MQGGAIFIKAGHFFKSSDALVSATSARGNDGTVTIDAPDMELNELSLLPSNLLDISGWVGECERGKGKSRFVIKDRDNVPIGTIKGVLP